MHSHSTSPSGAWRSYAHAADLWGGKEDPLASTPATQSTPRGNMSRNSSLGSFDDGMSSQSGSFGSWSQASPVRLSESRSFVPEADWTSYTLAVRPSHHPAATHHTKYSPPLEIQQCLHPQHPPARSHLPPPTPCHRGCEISSLVRPELT